MESGECDIYVVDLDGSGPPKRLTGEPGCETDLAWSPDDAEIAFTQQSGDGSGDTDIYKMNVGGSEATRLTFSPLSEGQPAWSPDGEQISFVRHMSGVVPGYAEGPMAIYKMAYDGTDPILLKDFEKAVARYPDWWVRCNRTMASSRPQRTNIPSGPSKIGRRCQRQSYKRCHEHEDQGSSAPRSSSLSLILPDLFVLGSILLSLDDPH